MSRKARRRSQEQRPPGSQARTRSAKARDAAPLQFSTFHYTLKGEDADESGSANDGEAYLQ